MYTILFSKYENQIPVPTKLNSILTNKKYITRALSDYSKSGFVINLSTKQIFKNLYMPDSVHIWK